MSKGSFDYDLFVIGAGSGGVRASRMAAQQGLKVAVAEDRYLGGTCVNVGCVPKKLFVYASEFAHGFDHAKGFGLSTGEISFDWATLRDNKTKEIERLNGIYKNLLLNAGVDLHWGRAEVVDANTVKVNGSEFRCERILLATGSWPHLPDIEGQEYLTHSNDVFYLEKFPSKVLCMGGGYISLEFAGIFNGLGADTTLNYRGDKILRGFDNDIRDFAQEEVKKSGVKLKLNANVESVKSTDEGFEVLFTDGITDTYDLVFCATGRRPNLTGLGIEHLNLHYNADGTLAVNDQYQTSESSIYALGDLTPGPQLTPVALEEAMVFVDHLVGKDRKLDYDNIPTAVFSQPNIGTVGLSQEEAIERGYEVEIFKSDFKPMVHTLSGSDERTLMKLIVDKLSDKVLGMHMVGPDAGEIIQGFAVALIAGATKAQFDQTVGIHPSAAEEFVTMRTPSK